ncbi:hypothetical protein ACFW9F_01645, partial [Streptomyces sp. NPDC059506]|uniref:hypothetical protein n=1 Tax=Streptomyces sp. NPDC059506 TaxID=3347751 RepID=UPI0036B65092
MLHDDGGLELAFLAGGEASVMLVQCLLGADVALDVGVEGLVAAAVAEVAEVVAGPVQGVGHLHVVDDR